MIFANDAQQIVGRERRKRVSQLAWCGDGCFDSRRRVNSTVMRCVACAAQIAEPTMKRAIVAIIVFACCAIAEAQTPTPTELGNRVDALARKMLSRPLAGISVAVARDVEVVFV